MTLSKRERYLVIGALATAVVLGGDYFLVEPLLAKRADLVARIEQANKQMDNTARSSKDLLRLRRRWNAVGGTTLADNASEAESQVLRKVGEWARDAGLTLSFKPERTELEKGFQKITYRAAGVGRMGQITRFLWHVQTAEIPITLADLQIVAHTEGSDDLSVQIGLSTLCRAPEAEKRQGVALAREAHP